MPPRVAGGVYSYGCGQLPLAARAFFARPRQAVPQSVGVPRTVGCGCGLCVFGCCCLRCWVVAWTCCTGAGSSPLHVFVCANVRSTCGVSHCGASATGSSGQQECSRESPGSERCRRRLSSGERSQSGKKRRGSRSPSPACSSCLARSSASSSSASSGAGKREGAMPPPHAGCPGSCGGRSGRDCSGSGHDRSPGPGPSGLDLGSRSLPVTRSSHPEYGGRSSPSPLGAGDDDHSSTVDSLNMDQYDSFRVVLCLIREFHSLEEPASVAPNRCKTSLAPVYGLQSESSPALHLPTSPLLRSLIEDTNSTLSKFWKTRPFMVSFPFLVVGIGGIIGPPLPLFLVCSQSRPVWPLSSSSV